MNLLELQKIVDSWIKKSGGYWTELEILGRLIEELGEVSQALRKGDKYKVKEEIGDLFFTLIVLSNKLNIDLEKSLKEAIRKYDKRTKRRKHYHLRNSSSVS